MKNLIAFDDLNELIEIYEVDSIVLFLAHETEKRFFKRFLKVHPTKSECDFNFLPLSPFNKSL